MAKKFAERTQLNLSNVNKEVLKMWDEADVFHKSLTEREGCPSFIFFEGPPSANGHPGILMVCRSSWALRKNWVSLKKIQVRPSQSKSTIVSAVPM